MIQSILDGMAGAIASEFGEDCEVYTEEIEQGLTAPCFYLSCVSAEQNRFRGDVHLAECRFMVLFFPGRDAVNATCMAAADRLYSALELIDTDCGKFLGKNIVWDVRDGLLNFSLTYSRHFRRVGAQDLFMETVTFGGK